ncbi:MAG: TIGR03089 family protein [Janthinobacterium lividum]
MPAAPSSTPRPIPRSVPALLQRLQTEDPTAPRLTFYGERYSQTGERIELSARVLSTWVAKTANLLEEEFEVGPGSVVALDLPTHWRTLVWQLATWATGGAVSLDAAAGGGDVFVSHDGEALSRSGADERVAVSLAPLATSFGSPVPEGVLDYSRVVTGYGDLHTPVSSPAPTDLAIVGVGGCTHGALLADASDAGAHWPLGVRLLTDTPPADVVRGALAAWCRGGSLVLAPDLSQLPRTVREQERVTTELLRAT